LSSLSSSLILGLNLTGNFFENLGSNFGLLLNESISSGLQFLVLLFFEFNLVDCLGSSTNFLLEKVDLLLFVLNNLFVSEKHGLISLELNLGIEEADF
jgi:hypothetical protein